MKDEKYESMKAASTAMLVFNTRDVKEGYKSVSEMVKRDSAMPWGNHIALTHVHIPGLTTDSNSDSDIQNFILKVHEETQSKKNSWANYLSGLFIDGVGKFKGPEVRSYIFIQRLKLRFM